MTRDQELKRDLKEEFPLTWWVFYHGLDSTLTKLAVLVGSGSGVIAVYLVLDDRGYLSVPFFGASAAAFAAATLLSKAQKLVGEIYDRR